VKGGNIQFGNFVDRLMACTLHRRTNLPPETALCIDIANLLRKHTVRGTYAGVWCHIPNEGKRSPRMGQLLKATGLLAGAPDYVFLWRSGAGMIEIKAKGRKGLSPAQSDFREWCMSAGIPWALCRSVAEVQDTLLAWGAILYPLPLPV
jgi:hypothetical protein